MMRQAFQAQGPHKVLSLLLESDSGLPGVRSGDCEPAVGQPCLPEWVMMMCATPCGKIRHLPQTFLTPAAALSGHVEDRGKNLTAALLTPLSEFV